MSTCYESMLKRFIAQFYWFHKIDVFLNKNKRNVNRINIIPRSFEFLANRDYCIIFNFNPKTMINFQIENDSILIIIIKKKFLHYCVKKKNTTEIILGYCNLRYKKTS